MKKSRDSGSGRRREGPRPHKRPGRPGGGSWQPGGRGGPWNPKSGHRLPLPKKTGGPIETKKGAKGYRRPTVKVPFPEDAVERDIDARDAASAHDSTPLSANERNMNGGGAALPRPQYETLDHTADLGIRVTAGTREELFENAGLALFDLLTDLSRVRATTRFAFSLKAENLEALLVQWLRELLYLFFGKKMVFCRLEIAELTEDSLSVTCWGERVDPERHVFRTEIKAVTYHGLRVARAEQGWTADVIFDI